MKQTTAYRFLSEVEGCQGIIHRICRIYSKSPEEKEDLFQEIMYQLWKSYQRFEGKSKFSTWLYKVALNTAITFYGKAKKRRQFEVILRRQPEVADSAPPSKEDLLGLMYRAIDKLGKVDRAILLLFLEKKSYDEISEIIGISKTYVGVKLNRIKKQLEKLVHEMDTETLD